MMDDKDIDFPSLLKQAAEVAARAYAPYSGFKVGAALLAADGRIFTGCNVENASYGLTLCAERNAVFAAVAAGVREFSALAVTADADAPPVPCGACLQVLAEFCDETFPILSGTTREQSPTQRYSLGDLLPRAFRVPRNDSEKDGKTTVS